MGKVQKKANDRHKINLSPALTEFISKTISLPLLQLPQHLSSFPFRWPFPRGDLYNWIDTLDRFDEVLHSFSKAYALDVGPQTKVFGTIILADGNATVDDVTLQEHGLSADGDRILVESILAFSRLLLEKCGNRTLYNSTERLNDLLNTTSLPLLHETLRLTHVLAQRFADRGPQAPGGAQFYHFDLDRLLKLATQVPRQVQRRGPVSPLKTPKNKDRSSQPKLRRAPTTADPNDLRALAKPTVSSAQDAVQEALDWVGVASVRVVWTPKESSVTTQRPALNSRSSQYDLPSSPTPIRQQQTPSRNAPVPPIDTTTQTPVTDSSGLRYIELDAPELQSTTPEKVLAREMPDMPGSSRYELLHKLRLAYGLIESDESRLLLVYIRLTALGVIGQVYLEEELTAKYFDGDSNASARQQLVQLLVDLLREPKDGRKIPLYLQSLAMETLAIMSRYRQMMVEILSSLTPNSSHGLLMSLIQKGIIDIENDGDDTDNEEGDLWRHAVFMMWMVFMNPSVLHPTRSTEQFMHKNLITAYASGLKVLTQKSLRIHVCIVKFLEHLFHSFKDGLQVLNANGAFNLICDLTDKLSSQALELCRSGQGAPEEWKTKGMDYRIPYMQQYVLREVVSLIKDVSKHQGNHADRALRGFVDSRNLLEAFKLILSHIDEFGAHTWSEIVTAVCAFLNNEPTSYTVVSEAGIITTLLSTIEPEEAPSAAEGGSRTISAKPSGKLLKLPASADAIVNLASSFTAICLTEAGHRRFVESGVLEKFFELFESADHVKAIKDTSVLVNLGPTFDELVRHHPTLKDLVVSSVATMIARVRYICRTHFMAIGAGPKIWSKDSSGLFVDDGAEALTREDIPHRQTDDLDFAPFQLANGVTLESGVEPGITDPALARNARDENDRGLSAADYARPAVAFLASFLDSHSLCKDLMNTGVTDLILDLVTLPTIPISDDAFGDGVLLQDLAAVIRQITEDKPYLVLPLLIDRARYACSTALAEFVQFSPDKIQCYFDQYLEIKDVDSSMDVDAESSISPPGHSGTRVVRSLMNVYSIVRVLTEIVAVSGYSRSAGHNSVLASINISDLMSELMLQLGNLSAACCREEISLLATLPRSWLDATRPGCYSTGDGDIDTILDVANDPEQNLSERKALPAESENLPSFRNLKTLRYLVSETPAMIATLFSHTTSSFNGRKKVDTFLKQKLHSVADCIARAMTVQLKPAFLTQGFVQEDPDRLKDWKFKYFAVVLSRLRNSLWEEIHRSDMPTSSLCQSYIVDCFRRADGLKALDAIGTEFYDELKQCQVDKPVVFAANSGLKTCLDLFADLTREDSNASQQSTYLKSLDKAKPFYFNPNQTLLELRMEALPLTRRIWDSDYAEQASGDVVKRLTYILKHVLKGDSEDSVFASIEDFPESKSFERREYTIEWAKVNTLREKGFEENLAQEALYRCNVGNHASGMTAAEEYCKAQRDNPYRRLLPAPAGDIRHKDKNSSTEPSISQLVSPPTAMEITSGPTATTHEDSSQEEDFDESLGMGRPQEVPSSEIHLPSLPVSASDSNISTGVAVGSSSAIADPSNNRYSKQSIDAERDSIREELFSRCNNVLSSHPSVIFDLNELLCAGAVKLPDDEAKEWWETGTNLLVTSLLSQGTEDDMDKSQGQKVAATSHLIGLLCNNGTFKPSMLKVLQDSLDEIVGFLKLPGPNTDGDDAYPWIAPILLIIERLLALDADPDSIEWTPPSDLDSYTEPKIVHNEVVKADSKTKIFQHLMDILPKVGKSKSMALAIARVLVILTRDRRLALLQGERRNLQKLFLMIKQLSGRATGRLQASLMIVLRHIIEDDATVKQIMGTEIVAWFRNRTSTRQADLRAYLSDLGFLALRSPALFVETSNEKIKLASWAPGHQGVNSHLVLRSSSPELVTIDEDLKGNAAEGDAAESVEQQTESAAMDEKTQEVKVPTVEHPDGVVHFLLSELLSYKEVEDKDSSQDTTKEEITEEPSSPKAVNGSTQLSAAVASEKSSKPRFTADEHPIFMYRCFLLHCLTELLYSYNQTKIEFISFSRKADPLAATPSKARSGVLNYLLNSLVSSGYVDKDESIACRKRMSTSDWAMRVIVALCTKTGEKDLGLVTTSRYSAQTRNVDDNDTEPDLMYVRRFVLDHAVKAFKDTVASPEVIQTRYGRLLCLAELFHKLITKPSGVDGTAFSNNSSYKRIARMMLEKNFIAVLTSAISDVDLSFPSAKKVIKFILRPLKELTSTATDLSINHPDDFPQIVDQAVTESISSASSEVSDLDDDREETPDLYRNSALGMLDPARQDGSDSEDDEDDDEQMDFDEYEDEMDYGEEMAAPINDGEVVSDEELEGAIDDAGPMEGLNGDVPMDIEFVVNHHHHHHHQHDDDDDESESSSDDDETDDDDEDPEDIEIEVNEDGDIEHDGSDVQDDEDGWEDEDEDGINDDGEEDEDEDDPMIMIEDRLQDFPETEPGQPSLPHITDLLRTLDEADLGTPELAHDGDVILQTNNGEDQDDNNQDEDDDEDDQGDNDGMDYDQPFDMMLDGPDYDENEDWGFDEPPPPAYQRRRGMAARVPVRGIPGDGRIIGIHDGRDMHHMLSSRHHRHAPPVRAAADDGLNPLLERPGMMHGSGDIASLMGHPVGFTLQGGPGALSFFPPGGGEAVITMDGSLGLGGHGAILDAIMGAIQRGDSDLLQNGRISFNVAPPTAIRNSLRPAIPPSAFNRPSREDAHKSVAFLPMLTVSRWQAEADVVFGAKNFPTKIHPIQIRVYATLMPLAQEEEKERQLKQEEERKAKVEREAQEKAEAERLRKEDEERIAKEKAEAQERAKEEAEARALAEAEQSQTAAVDTISGDAMEGVQSEGVPDEAAEPAEERARTYTTIRGQQLDITGLDIDAEYLEALPEEIREEVITAQYQMRREQAQEQGNDDSAIDQEFLDALPEDIREEIRAQEVAAQRRRDRERARREAQTSGANNNVQDAGMEPDDFLATLDPALRRAILAEQPPEILNSLNAQHAAEGRAIARNMFFQRMPAGSGGELAVARRVAAAQRDTRRQQIVQLIDKAGVATLLRLMFMQQQGSLKVNLLNILSQICGNRQTRYEVVSLLLVILKEGSTDVTAIERSLQSLSLRAKATASQKTPQPLKRTLSIQPYAGLGEDVTPMMVVQQCLVTLSHICRHNPHVKSLFLREVDVTSTNKSKGKAKGKSKESRTTTHPVNDLIGLLDRRLIMDSAGCLQYLASLLATVTSPLASLMKQERERLMAEQEAEAKAKAEKEQKENDREKSDEDAKEQVKDDVPMEDVPESSAAQGDLKPEASEDLSAKKDQDENAQATEPDRRRPFEPPAIADENLKLITSIFVAPECGQETFKATLETLQSLSHIPSTSEKFGEELKVHVRALSQSICTELEELLPVIEDAQTSTDVSGAAAAKFSASTSDQVKLLRVLQALDYLSLTRKEDETSSGHKPKSILTTAYESLGLSPVWAKLSDCLSAVEEKGDTISFANILLPLIESLMVVCKHTTLKESPVQVKEAVLTSPIAAAYQDELEELFFKFSSDHRKILNDIVRQNPKLMQGHFSILVKNSKVLDFDNKRNYFSKQMHSRHHNNRHPQPPLQLNVRREQVFIDSYKALYYKTADEMKFGKLNIRFNGEEGVDAGGVTREWFQVLARGMFDPNYALFQPVASDKTTFHPSTLSFVNPEHLLYFKFIGRIIGKALHENRVLDCHFSRAVYKRILGKKPNLKDLESNDMDYYKSLCWILENDITDILEEDFSVIENEFGEEKTIDLIPNGRTISVTEDNKKEYVQKLVEYRLTESVKEQLDSFLGGFHDIIPAELIAIFNEQELELLISGLPEIDVDDWKANTEYHNYNPSSQQIVWFWRIVKAMTNEERAKLLQFITGTSKVPLNGFKELEGVSGLTRCNIHKDPSTNRLPTSHTCFNQLDLPAYESFDIMKQNITTAISLGADYFGFA